MYIQQLEEILPPPSQNSEGACDQITCLNNYYISSRLLILLNVTDALIKFPYILNHTVSIKILNFGFQIGLHLFLKVCYVQVLHVSDYLHSFDLDPVPTATLPASFNLKNVGIPPQTRVFGASIHADLDSL